MGFGVEDGEVEDGVVDGEGVGLVLAEVEVAVGV